MAPLSPGPDPVRDRVAELHDAGVDTVVADPARGLGDVGGVLADRDGD